MIRVLMVDDDAGLRTLVADYLTRYGMKVDVVPDGAGLRAALPGPARRSAPGAAYDVLLLDLMLPDESGLDLCRWLNAHHPLPIIMLTAQGDPASRIVGLELGADDYLPKPFEPRELVARIHAVLRRSGLAHERTPVTETASVLRFHGWVLDRMRRQLTSPEQVVLPLSSAQYRLLAAFVEHPRRVLSRERLLELSRTPGIETSDRSIDLAVSRLRQKLGDAGLIRTVRGEGYLFEADPA